MQTMRFQSLEAFRGIAAISIIFYHSMFTSGVLSNFRLNSYLFVDFFFILSGFIISFAYMQKLTEKKVSTKTFFIKRIFRLYPMHLFMLAIWGVYIFVKHWAFTKHLGGQDPFIANNLTSFVQHLLLVQTFGTGNIMAWNVPSWSVSVEIFAYIIFFIFVKLFTNSHVSVKLLTSFLLIIVLKGLLIIYPTELQNFTFLFNGLSTFFMGIILYIMSRYKPKYTPKIWLSNILEIITVLSIVLLLNMPIHSLLNLTIIQLLFTLSIYVFAIQEKGIVSKVLHYRAFQYLGLLSYSIYLIHAIVVELVGHIFEYVLKSPISYQGSHKVLILPYGDLINILLVGVVVFLAHFTYHNIEQALRK